MTNKPVPASSRETAYSFADRIQAALADWHERKLDDCQDEAALLAFADLWRQDATLVALRAERRAEEIQALRDAEQGMWARAIKADTTEAYQAYLSANPKGRFRDDANARLLMSGERQAWDAAERAGAASALMRFLAAWPDGKRADDARRRLEQLHAARRARLGHAAGVTARTIAIVMLVGGVLIYVVPLVGEILETVSGPAPAEVAPPPAPSTGRPALPAVAGGSARTEPARVAPPPVAAVIPEAAPAGGERPRDVVLPLAEGAAVAVGVPSTTVPPPDMPGPIVRAPSAPIVSEVVPGVSVASTEATLSAPPPAIVVGAEPTAPETRGSVTGTPVAAVETRVDRMVTQPAPDAPAAELRVVVPVIEDLKAAPAASEHVGPIAMPASSASAAIRNNSVVGDSLKPTVSVPAQAVPVLRSAPRMLWQRMLGAPRTALDAVLYAAGSEPTGLARDATRDTLRPGAFHAPAIGATHAEGTEKPTASATQPSAITSPSGHVGVPSVSVGKSSRPATSTRPGVAEKVVDPTKAGRAKGSSGKPTPPRQERGSAAAPRGGAKAGWNADAPHTLAVTARAVKANPTAAGGRGWTTGFFERN